jgi:hypothetical protein
MKALLKVQKSKNGKNALLQKLKGLFGFGCVFKGPKSTFHTQKFQFFFFFKKYLFSKKKLKALLRV